MSSSLSGNDVERRSIGCVHDDDDTWKVELQRHCGGGGRWHITLVDHSKPGYRGQWHHLGAGSLKFDLNSLNANGKIWIERAFAVEPKRKYKVNLNYAFDTSDCGDELRFRIKSRVFRRHPETGDDLAPAFQEKTASTGCTWGWPHKSYDFRIKSKKATRST